MRPPRHLTPHLRSPTERALSMADIAWMGSHFRGYRRGLQAVDRKLLAAAPALGRFYWETVITCER